MSKRPPQRKPKGKRRRTKAPRRKKRPRRRAAWPRYTTPHLLEVRLKDLGVSVERSWLRRPVQRLHDELAARDLRLRPHVWLSEEWFCPDGIPGIAVPFYLAHRRLMQLERNQMFEVEGGNFAWCMQILRHEAGHALQNAFRLHHRADWRRHFGSSAVRYPDTYVPRPGSRNYVLHLQRAYAQSHPAEDFAETFAVWLKPRSQWRRRYAGWPALKKLEYVDRLMGELAGRAPPVRSRAKVEPLSSLTKTVGEHYAEKKARYSAGFPDVYDRDLKRMFSDAPRHARNESAAQFLRRNRGDIRYMVARWTGEYELTLNEVMRDMIGRCRELGLRVVGAERQVRLDFAILLTARTMEYLFRSRRKHRL